MLKVLCTAEFDDMWEKKMKEYCDIRRVGFSLTKQPKDRLNEEQLIEALKGVDVFIVGYEKVTENVLYHAPDVKLLLSVRAVSYTHLDVYKRQQYSRLHLSVISANHIPLLVLPAD